MYIGNRLRDTLYAFRHRLYVYVQRPKRVEIEFLIILLVEWFNCWTNMHVPKRWHHHIDRNSARLGVPLMTTTRWKYSLIDVKKSDGQCQVGQCANVGLIIKPSLCYILFNYSLMWEMLVVCCAVLVSHACHQSNVSAAPAGRDGRNTGSSTTVLCHSLSPAAPPPSAPRPARHPLHHRRCARASASCPLNLTYHFLTYFLPIIHVSANLK